MTWVRSLPAAPSRCGCGPSGPEQLGWLINQLGNPSFNPVKMPGMTMNNLNSNTSKIHTQYTSNTNLINLIHLIHPQYRHSTSKPCQYILNLQARCIRCILMYWMLIHRLNCKYIQNTRKYTVNTSTGLPPIFDFGENTKKRLIHGILSVFPMYMPFNTSSMY